MKPDDSNKTFKRCGVAAIALWTAAGLCYLAHAKGLAIGLVVLGVILELVAILVMWFASEEQKRDRE